MAGSDRDQDASVIERRDGADAWLDQARWLHQQEIARLDGTRSRATTMQGFAGGIRDLRDSARVRALERACDPTQP